MHTNVSGEVLVKVASARLAGKSLPQIAEELNRDAHLKPARGGRWSVSTVRSYALEAGRRLRMEMNLTTRRALA
jgi:hypothetical protein